MERASEAVARECVRAIAASPLRGERVVVLCGTGNNGGDGFGAARLLRHSPATGEVLVLLVGVRGRVSGDAAEMLRRLENEGGVVAEVCGEEGLEPLRGATLVVDALFGTGLSRPVEVTSLPALAFRLASSRRAFVVAVDVPSGLDSGSERADVPHVRADLTVTFGFPKLAHLQSPAASSCGRVVVADIGLLSDEGEVHAPEAVTARDVAPLFPRRPAAAHKGTFGTLGIIGGARGMAGAAALAARSAFRCGAGKVVVVAEEASRAAIHALVAEATTSSVLVPAGLTALAVGPGLGTSPASRVLLDAALDSVLPAVLDADALNLLGGPAGAPAGPKRTHGPDASPRGSLPSARSPDRRHSRRGRSGREAALRTIGGHGRPQGLPVGRRDTGRGRRPGPLRESRDGLGRKR